MIQRSPECQQEVESREYPYQQLPSFTIQVEKISVEPEVVSKINAYGTTSKGIEYEFIESTGDRTAEYSKVYKFAFFSPKPITDLLSESAGMMHGYDDIYARYEVTMGVYESYDANKQITKESVILLAEKLIDSIEFTQPIDISK